MDLPHDFVKIGGHHHDLPLAAVLRLCLPKLKEKEARDLLSLGCLAPHASLVKNSAVSKT